MGQVTKYIPEEFKLDPARLQLRGNFDKQVAEIFHYIRMPKRRVKNLKKMFAELEETLNKLFVGCHVRPFGSIVTGLALKTSDVDCFIDNCNEDPITCIDKTVAYLKKRPHVFKNVNVMTNKKLSVIKVFYSKFIMACDISFSGPRAVNIGQLISYLLQMDCRALHLTILIKYWAKVHNITGPKLLPNFALICLIIFFLQEKEILPSVASLQENLPPNIIDEWNVAFERIKPSSNNRESLYQLLGEFFEYYRDFDFADLIVTPYLGCPVKRRNFLDVNRVPSEFKLYKVIGGHSKESIRVVTRQICIQCPFEHSRNIAIAVNDDLASKIISRFKEAAYMYENFSKSEFLGRILQKHSITNSIQASGFLYPEHGFHGLNRIARGQDQGTMDQSHALRGHRRGYRGQRPRGFTQQRFQSQTRETRHQRIKKPTRRSQAWGRRGHAESNA